MSRATRPLRRVRGDEREAVLVAAGVFVAAGLGGPPRYPFHVSFLERAARRLGCRPSHLRRCLLGRVVSARAAGRILEAAGARLEQTTGREPQSRREPGR